MSYILDAIKKADQKRKLGEVPDVNTIHETPIDEPRRYGWLYGVAAIFFVNAGGLAWWLWLKTPGPESVAQAPTSQVEVMDKQLPSLSTFQTTDLQKLPAVPVATAPPTMLPPVEPLPPSRPQVVSAPRPAQEAAPSSGKRPPPVKSQAVAPVQKVMTPPPVAEQVPIEEAADSYEQPFVEEETLSAEEDVEASALRGQVMAPIAISSETKKGVKKARREEEEPELVNIPFLKQLPVEVQKSLPELHISFHSYSIKPSARLVSIGGKILRQGQEIDDNLKLEKITVTGVVLNFNGKRFRLDV